MIRIAVVDDSPQDQEALQTLLLAYQSERKCDFQLSFFNSASEFWMKYKYQFDLVFMDIEMPNGESGLDIARRLFKDNQEVKLIFVTSFVRYAIEGYDVDAISFLKKPAEKTPLFLSLDKAIKRIVSSKEDNILLTNKEETKLIPLKDITYFEIYGHSCYCHINNGEEFAFTDSLKNLESKLSAKNFFRIKSSYLVNLAFVEGISNGHAIVAKQKLSISRRLSKAFMDAYTNYLGNHI